ncbi:MAG: flagellar hook-basal body complex protein, partial [bacterium]|nr:flagellar hook-basal body complex protein [bacterium]
MFRSMYSGVTGIKLHQTWLDLIGDNVANVNTVGYKRSRALFSSKFSEMLESANAPREGRGGENPKQIGLGTKIAQLQTIHTQGAMKETGKDTDIAIEGDGYFILKELGCHLAHYSRAGAFDFDRDGDYVDPSTGFHVQGWNAEREKNSGLKIDPLTGKSIINVGKPIENIKIEMNDVLPAKATNEIRIAGNLNSESPFMIDKEKISFTKGVRSTSVASAGEGIDITKNWIDAGFESTPDGTITINGATFSLDIFTTPKDLMNAINKSSQANVTIEYDEGTDRFNIKPDGVGIDIELSENPKTTGCGFFSQAKIPLGTFNTSVEMVILFTHLFDPMHPDRTYVRWKAVKPETWELINTNAYFYKAREEVGEGNDKIAVTDEYVGLGDGVKRTFQLANPDVDYLSLKVYQDGTEVTNYTFSNNTGPNGVDEITFKDPPGSGVKITASYDRIGFNLDETSVDPTTLIAKVDEVIQARTVYYVSNNTGPGGVDQIIFKEVKDAEIGTGNGVATRFKLDSNLVDSRTLRVYLNGIEQRPRTDWMFHNNTGPGGVDEIEFIEAPGDNVAIKADYYYAPEGREVISNYVVINATAGTNTYDLESPLVDPNNLIVYVNGIATTNYTFSDNTGTNGVDQITLQVSAGDNVCIDYIPLKAQKVTADYYYNKNQEAKGILQLDKDGKVINNFVDTEAFPAIVSGSEVIAGPSTVDLASGWDQFDGGTVNGTITIITTSGRYVSRPINATNYPTVQNLINEINASDAKVTMSYDITTDKFTLKSDTPGDIMTLEESGTVPFLSEINIPTGTVEGGNNNGVMDLETEIPDPALDGWRETTGIKESGKDYFRVNISPNTVSSEPVGKGGEEVRGTKVTGEEVGTGGGGRLVMGEELFEYGTNNAPIIGTYDLGNKDVNPNTIRLWYYDLSAQSRIEIPSSMYQFMDNTGTGWVDQINISEFPVTPATGDGIIIDYN